MSEKKIKERVVNCLLLLRLIREASKIAEIEDNMKLQKLVFLVQKRLNATKKKGFSYIFFRWHKGPFSASLNLDLTELKDKYIIWATEKIEPTKDALALLKEYEDVFRKNAVFAKGIDRVVEEYAHLSSEQLKEVVYDQKVMVPRIHKYLKIREIPEGQLLLYGLSEEKASATFSLDDGELATAELLFDREAINMLRKAQDDAKEGRTCKINFQGPTTI